MKSSIILQTSLWLCIFLSTCQTPPKENSQTPRFDYKHFTILYEGIVRGDTTQKTLSLVFTGDEFADGADHIIEVLNQQNVKGSFFFTGNFYRNLQFAPIIKRLKEEEHYLGAHSDRHLLYCTWENRDSLLVSKKEFVKDLEDNYLEMSRFGIGKKDARFFLPPYEWYNDSISIWTKEAGLSLTNFTYGTRSNADYTTPEMKNYRNSEVIYQSILNYEASHSIGLNGFIMLIHIGTDSARTDKFYHRLEELIMWLKSKEYELVRVDKLLNYK